MKVSCSPKKGDALLTVAEAIGLMFGFGMFIISLIKLILIISNKDDKNDRP